MIELLIIDTEREQPIASLFSCERELRPLFLQLTKYLSETDQELYRSYLHDEGIT